MSHPPAASVAPTNKYFYIKMLCKEQGEKNPSSSSSFLKIYLFLFLFYVYSYMYACTPCVPGSLKDLKRVLDSLEPESRSSTRTRAFNC